MRIAIPLCLLAASCATGPQIHPDLHGQSEELVAAMRVLARDYVEPPGRHSQGGGMGWPVWPYGMVVAIDGPMIAIRMNDPKEASGNVEDALMPISTPEREDHHGHGVVAGRHGDVLICRFFPWGLDSDTPPQIGDSAHLITTWQRYRR